ncbi:hypothetical protein CB1_000251004 [Camelus ferus]|nr:hypothetical protein CB1_000251004 [Camelus ferus]
MCCAALMGGGEVERMFTGGRGLTASVGAGLSSGQGIWGPPDGLQPLSHCEDPQQCILLPHQAVGRGRERVLPAPPPLVIKGMTCALSELLLASIALERFGEEMKFDITPAGTSVYKSKSGQERKEEEPTNSRFDDRLKQVLPFWLLSGTL